MAFAQMFRGHIWLILLSLLLKVVTGQVVFAQDQLSIYHLVLQIAINGLWMVLIFSMQTIRPSRQYKVEYTQSQYK